MNDLSILIPARNEMFLSKTIESILANIEADTEVIAVLDGELANPPIPQHERVNVIFLPESIGQRAATNLAARLSKAKYVMKCDAHCSFDKGFDRKMIEAFKTTGDNATMVPIMRNLWAFDWKCYHCGWKKYQGPTPKKCDQCGKTDKIRRKMIWIGKHNPQSTSYCFDSTPHFQYFEDWKHRPQYEKDKKEKGLTETMSLQGSCWMLTRDKYWELNICDENFGSWGSQGIEVAAKTWLSGGAVIVNHKTWYAHMFRTQGGDFGFPYSMSGTVQAKAKSFARDLFFKNKWDKQIHPLSWLVEKFWPVKGWTEEDLQKLKANTFQFSTKNSNAKPEESEPTPNLLVSSGPTEELTDTKGDTETEALTKEETLTEGLAGGGTETEAESETEVDGLTEALGDTTEAQGKTLGLIETDSDTDELTDGLIETVGDAEAEAEGEEIDEPSTEEYRGGLIESEPIRPELTVEGLEGSSLRVERRAEELLEKGVIYYDGISEANVTRLHSARLAKDKEMTLFKNDKVTIIGHGWVGKSVHTLFPDAYIYSRATSGTKKIANKGEVAFICVPTPPIGEGELDTSIVEECVAWCQSPLIVIRSTVNPGTCDYLSRKYNKRIIMQPEYLGETPQHPLLDEKSTPFLVIGGSPKDLRILINLYTKVYNANVKIRQVSAYEAEVIKLTENRAIAFKVAQCQELYDVCEKAGIDYYTIRDAVYGDDPRFNLWWTFVFPDKRGLQSKCLPKDVYAWCAWAESLGVKVEITRSLLISNKKWISQGL